MDSLRDIKPDVLIPDTSLYLFILLIFFGILVVGLIVFVLSKFFKKKPKSKKAIAIKNLKNIDFADSKKAAYCISKYTPFLTETSQQEEFLKELDGALIKYKYKRDVVPFSEEDKQRLKAFMEMCGV